MPVFVPPGQPESEPSGPEPFKPAPPPEPKPRPHRNTGQWLTDSDGRKMLGPETGAFLIHDPTAEPCCPDYEPGQPCPVWAPGATPHRVAIVTSGVVCCNACRYDYYSNQTLCHGLNAGFVLEQAGNPCQWALSLPDVFEFRWWDQTHPNCSGPPDHITWNSLSLRFTVGGTPPDALYASFGMGPAGDPLRFYGVVDVDDYSPGIVIPNQQTNECYVPVIYTLRAGTSVYAGPA